MNEPPLSILDYMRLDDIDALRKVMTERAQPRTLENATTILRAALSRKPQAWTITPEELPALWQALVVEN